MRTLAVVVGDTPVQFDSRDGHLQACFALDEQGGQLLYVYDHQGNLLDVLHPREPAAQATGSASEVLKAGLTEPKALPASEQVLHPSFIPRSSPV